ncbi:hypothetical protein O9K51_00319 [Purpureocillium lavendulum]|uniref:Uncharacterized protein n=1 Tax=Purpureocillium lavendulum TaxID=1247861 RepID=A0AB34G1L9_9HYPO|nr:hypothetical protein O9K51_00319 [Purpureocillium lavendulum]
MGGKDGKAGLERIALADNGKGDRNELGLDAHALMDGWLGQRSGGGGGSSGIQGWWQSSPTSSSSLSSCILHSTS